MASDANDVVTAPTENGVVIEYMDESTSGRHVEKHTTARTVGDFIRVESLSANATVSVNDIIASADGATPINAGDTVTVVSGNKTGGIGVQRLPATRKTKANRGFDATLANNGILLAEKKVNTIFKGRKLTHTVLEGLEMPERNISTRGTKYPFHVLEVGQCYTQILTKQVRVNTVAAIRNFTLIEPSIVLQARTFMLGNEAVFGVWRTA